MNTVRASSLLVMTLIALGRPTAAWAGNVFRLDQQVGFATFTNTEECIVTTVTVFAVDAVLHFPPGPGASDSTCYVSVSRFDSCTGAQLFGAEGLSEGLADRDFVVSSTLEKATLSCTVEDALEWVSGTPVDFTVSLSWTATGQIERSNAHVHESFPSCIRHGNFVSRAAEARGTVSDGITNFASLVSDSASLDSGKNGSAGAGCE